MPGCGGANRYGESAAYEHKIRADVFGDRGDKEAALAELKLSVEADPKDFLLRTEYATLLMETGDIEGAQKQIFEALNNEPSAPLIWITQANLYIKQGATKKAEAAAIKGMQVDQDDIEAPLWLADFYKNKGDTMRLQQMHQVIVERSR